MDTIRSYLVTGAKIYNCKHCAHNKFCIGKREPKTAKNFIQPFHRHYPGMLDIQNPDINNDSQIWCLTCGIELSEKDKTPCHAFFCPTCKIICPIVMKEAL
ncbi:MAG: hypothetical protein JSV76_03065 [Candidatus Bathyarchaeota archaeon]|nr:MAG: hypothetical protein JSV76_03065 [Candidatus Bathyarchaeota archaeon]